MSTTFFFQQPPRGSLMDFWRETGGNFSTGRKLSDQLPSIQQNMSLTLTSNREGCRVLKRKVSAVMCWLLQAISLWNSWSGTSVIGDLMFTAALCLWAAVFEQTNQSARRTCGAGPHPHLSVILQEKKPLQSIVQGQEIYESMYINIFYSSVPLSGLNTKIQTHSI